MTDETLAALLYAFATGYPDRASEIVHGSEEFGDDERARFTAIAEDTEAPPAERARRLGDALRELGSARHLTNECYRAAFYLDDEVVALSKNPLFAYFVSHRSGRLLDKWVHYFPIYDRHLSPYRGRDPRVLEIGIGHGASLEMWGHYFGSSSTIVGADIDESARSLADPSWVVLIGDQANPDFLRTVVDEHGPFDIVIDDGGHTMEQQITSAEALFPLLAEGGVYIVEDSHTSYWEEYGGGERRDGTFVEWIKRRIDDLHRYHLADPVDPVWTVTVDAIHCYDSVVVLDKKTRTPPFSEQMGTSDFIFLPRPVSALVGEMLASREDALRRRMDAEAELVETVALNQGLEADRAVERRRIEGELSTARLQNRELESDLRRAERELKVAHDDVRDLSEHTKAMRRTVSWRLTWPLRSIRRFLRGR